MRRTLLGLMLAATAAVPAIAAAQQAPDPAQQRDRGNWGRRGDGGGRRGEAQPQPQSNQQQPARARGEDGGRREQFRAQPQPDQAEQPGRRWGGERNSADRGAVQAEVNRQSRSPYQEQQQRQQGGYVRGGDVQRGDGRQDGARQDGWQQRQGWSNGEAARGRPGGRDQSSQWQGRDGGRNGARDGNRYATGGQWDRNWRGSDRYDYRDYRAANRGAFRLPRYYAPGGWNGGYRRFSIGIRLSSLLFDQSYWIDDPYDYRLPPAYGPYRWVRYYDDALLVDIRSGYVVDTVYDIFW